MLSALILVLALNDPVTEAGTAYRQALEALGTDNYEGAITLLRVALQKVGDENDQLRYRDSTARWRHAYYPHYLIAKARQLQARQEPSILSRRDLLKDAMSRLGQTRHPEGNVLLEEVKTELEAVEKAIKLDGSFAATKTRIEVLGTGERFEEAFTQLEDAAKTYTTRQKEIVDLRGALKERQTALERRFEQVLTQRLGDVSLVDPVTAGESIMGILKPAQIPPESIAKPGPPFQWLARFLELWEKNLEVARKSGDLTAAETNALAASFETMAVDSLKLGVPIGFRAARHLSHAVRMAKLNKIAKGDDDTIDTATAAAIVKFAAETADLAQKALASLPEGDATIKTLENDVPSRQKLIDELSRKITDGAKERARLTAPIVAAEASLSDPDTLGSTAALTKLKDDLFELESEATFGSLTGRLRARALMAHAIVEGVLGFLEGQTFNRVVERCRVPAWRAYGFDPKVDVRWATKLSPKLVKVLDQIKPQ
jgi:hypothetical protein